MELNFILVPNLELLFGEKYRCSKFKVADFLRQLLIVSSVEVLLN